jgi:hypothetical protein
LHKDKRVCVLERGQWWVSPEMPSTSQGTTDGNSTVRQYLEEGNIPYSTYIYPDNIKGLLRVFGNSRTINCIRGLYDYRIFKNVHVVAASGVGGGSLVYFNVTEKPDSSIYKYWPIQSDKRPLDAKYFYKDIYGKGAADKHNGNRTDIDGALFDYFDIAANFIGVNTITTTAALGKFKLPRTKVFQDTARKMHKNYHILLNSTKTDYMGNLDLDLDAKLSITDIPDGLFNDLHPTKIEKLNIENNVCQRQGRCGLGCIPESRHTLNYRFFDAISAGKPIDIFSLCNVDRIEESHDNSSYRYKVFFKDYRNSKHGNDMTIQANQVILAAGTLGSTEILLRSDALQLSKALGTRFSTNGDTFGVINPTREIVNATLGSYDNIYC